MSRTRVMAPVGSVLVVALLVAGCSGGGTSRQEQDGDRPIYEITDSMAAASGPVDSFTWSISQEPTSLDPARRARNQPSETVRAAICESLFRVNPDRTVDPALAESVDNPDPLTWIYSIRDGVTFHDGSPLTAQDVVASLSRHMDPAVGSVAAGAFANVASIEATGPLEVTVTLTKPDYLFNELLGGEAGRIESAAFLAEAGSDYGSPEVGLNCTGPYQFDRWETGRAITLVKYDGYWDQATPPMAGQVTISFVSDASARINTLLAGDVDGTYNAPSSGYERLLASDTGTLLFGPATATQSMIVNTEGVLGDVRLRQALSMALDRTGLIAAGYDGYGTPARVPIGEYAWAKAGPDRAKEIYESLPDTSSRDVEAARQLVSDAGAEGKEIVISYSTIVSEMRAMADAVYAAAQEIGLSPELNELSPPDYSALASDPEAKNGTDVWPVALRQLTGDPLETFVNFQTGNGFNYGLYSNAEYDAAVDEALAEPDPVKRAELAAELAQVVAEEVPWIPLVVPASSLFLDDRLTGAPTAIEVLYPWAGAIGEP